MKTPASLFRSFWMAMLLCCVMPSKAQDNEAVLTEFVRNEATYTNQSYQIERSSLEKPVTLRQQLNEWLGPQTYTNAYVVYSHMGGMEHVAYTDVNELLDKDPIFLSYDRGDAKLERKMSEPNTSIYLNYKNAEGKNACLVIHNRHRGYLDAFVYTRTSMMMPAEDAEDDLRSFHSKSAPVMGSYLSAFDVKEMQAEMAQFKVVLAKTVEKYQNDEALNDMERECLAGLTGEEEFSYNLGYGGWLYGNDRFYDAYVYHQAAFELLKKHLPNVSPEMNDTFYEMTHMMGISLWKLGLYESAEYYLNLALYGNESYASDYVDFRRSLENSVKKGASELTSRITVGDALSVLFDVHENNLREAFYVVGDQPVKLATQADVWDFDLKKLCTPDPSNLVIAYSRTYYENNDSSSLDKSVLFYENNIIFSSVQVDEKRWRINVMIPNSRNGDYRKPGERTNLPLSASFIVGSEEMEPIKIGKKKHYAALAQGMEKADELKADMRMLESLVLLKQMQQVVSLMSEKERSKEKLSTLHAQMLYETGFLLTELNQGRKALSYLISSMKKMPAVDTMIEYISILSNFVDPRGLAVIKSELEKSPTDKSYEDFLNRRYAYLLIEYGMFDEAEEVLNRLLKSPGSASFARQELEYIKSLRKKQ